MTTRWIVAAAVALGAGAVAAPMLLGGGGRIPEAAPDPAGEAVYEKVTGCQADKKLDYSQTLKDMHEATVRLADYKGKILLLNFWGTWCPPCRAEIPELIKIADAYRDKGVVVLGLAQQDTPAELRAFAQQYKMNYPSLLSTPEIEEAFGPMWAVPTSLIIDRSGALCFKHMGQITREQIEKALRPLL